jgi:acyl dehydratase
MVGDLLRSQWRLLSVTEKATSVGDGAFLLFESIVHNQRDELVAQERTTTLRYEPRPGATGRRPAPPDAGPATGEIGPCRIALTLQRLVMAAGANRDFAPVHHDPDVAARAGLVRPFANSMFVLTHLERAVVDWAGWESKVKGISMRLVAPALAGTTMVATGRRLAGHLPPAVAHCELECRLHPGAVNATATAEISLGRSMRSPRATQTVQ